MTTQPRIAIFAVSCAALPLIHHLQQRQLLAGVLTTEAINPDTYQLHQQLQAMQIPAIAYQPKNSEAALSTLDRWQANLGIVFTFSHILPEPIVSYFNTQLFNLHPSALPDYRGPAPLYWQLRHGQSNSTLTLHRVTSRVDAGEIGLQQPLDIHPFDTLQTLNNRMAMQAPVFVEEFLLKLRQDELEWHAQSPTNDATFYAGGVTWETTPINWQQCTSRDVINMARAGNPYHGGGLLDFGSVQGQLLSAREGSHQAVGIKPGTILMVDKTNGLAVSTIDGAVNLEVISNQEGVFTGYKFAMLYGLSAGQQLLNKL